MPGLSRRSVLLRSRSLRIAMIVIMGPSMGVAMMNDLARHYMAMPQLHPIRGLQDQREERYGKSQPSLCDHSGRRGMGLPGDVCDPPLRSRSHRNFRSFDGRCKATFSIGRAAR